MEVAPEGLASRAVSGLGRSGLSIGDCSWRRRDDEARLLFVAELIANSPNG